MDNLTPITREEILMNDEPLTPITREEKILAGEDLNPVTRREYFLKKYRHAGGDVMVEELSVTANGTYTAPEGKAYSPVEVNVPMPENAYLLKEASGSLVSFSDGADLPMPSFVCNIDAVQDLHGYDAPWPAGGGKNKLPLTLDNIKALNTAGTWDGNTYTHPYGVTFTFTANNDGSITSIKADGTYPSNNVTLYLQQNITNSTYPNEMILSGCTSGGGSSTYKVRCQMQLSPNTTIADDFGEGANFTIPNDGNIYQVIIRIQSGVTVSNLMFYPMVRVATVTDATFDPYSNICPISGHTGLDAVISPTTEASAGTTYSVSWQTEAGEVFGGYVDLVSGELTITHKYKLFDGTEAWTITTSSSGSNYITIDDMKVGTRMNGICNFFDTFITGTTAENAGKCQFGNDNQRLYILNAKGVYDADTQAKMRALTTGMQIVYPLATPITIQLTPTQIKSLLGNNNAWCSTGEVVIDYFAKEV